MKDYYTILNVSPFDSQWEIDEKLSSSIMRARWVSDTDNELPYQDILEAYFIIGDPHRRLEYDRQRLKLGLGKTRLIDLHSSSTARSDQSLSLNDLRSMTLKILPSPFDWCEIPGVDDYELITRWDPEGYGCGYTSWNHGSFHIPSFIISKFPITVAQYRAFLYAADGAQNETWYEGFPRPNADNIRWFDPVYEEDTSPITNIHWYDASAMCQWLGNRLGLRIRLPSEWEWQWAGQGPDGRNYPWGNEHHHAFDEPRINLLDEASVPVDSFPLGASPFGVMDMLGNCREWCSNMYYDPRLFHSEDGSSFDILQFKKYKARIQFPIPNSRVLKAIGASNPMLQDRRSAGHPGDPEVELGGFRCVCESLNIVS
jgi:curved DNA-binding protein CbpA